MGDPGSFTQSSCHQTTPSMCLTWSLWPKSSITCRSNETKLNDPMSHRDKAAAGPGVQPQPDVLTHYVCATG